jgi:ABC-type Fe3+/spermidine/putrescine transport system ATPase subunit
VLRIEGLRKAFGAVRAVVDFTLEVAPGEFVCVLGPSGCGKSTLLNLISGFLWPDAGRIIIDGQPAEGLPPNRRPTAMVFQNYALFPHLDVLGNVAFGLRIRRQDPRTIRRKVEAALDLVKLPDVGARLPRQLSGGQQQRVALARALVVEPKVLLLDEPLSNLDAKLREEMRVELKELQRTVGITTLFVTHDQEEAFELGDRIVLMNQGRVEQVGTPADLYERPRTAFVGRFIGRANLLEGCIVRRTAEGAVVAAGGVEVAAALADGTVGETVRLLLRPERIAVSTERPGGPNVLEGTVRRVSYLGPDVRYVVEVGKLSLLVARPNTGQAALAPGGRAFVAFGTELPVIPPCT